MCDSELKWESIGKVVRQGNTTRGIVGPKQQPGRRKKKDGGIIHTRGIAVGHGKGAAATNTAAHGRPETLGFGLLDLDVLATKKKKKPEIS